MHHTPKEVKVAFMEARFKTPVTIAPVTGKAAAADWLSIRACT
jgi:hypothetical protein